MVTTLAQNYFKPPGILRILNGAIGKYFQSGLLFVLTASNDRNKQ